MRTKEQIECEIRLHQGSIERLKRELEKSSIELHVGDIVNLFITGPERTYIIVEVGDTMCHLAKELDNSWTIYNYTLDYLFEHLQEGKMKVFGNIFKESYVKFRNIS